MSKYIIEIEDVPFSKVRIDADNGAQNINLYRVKGFNALVFDKNGLDKLTPLDEALEEAYKKGVHDGSLDVKERVEGAYQKGYDEAKLIYQNPNAESDYQRGLEDAWEAARKIVAGRFKGKLDTGCILNYTASEAIEKIKAYEEQQKADDEIKVGDEVYANTPSGKTPPFIITKIYDRDDGKYYTGINADGNHVQGGLNYIKTGRHFPQVAELLNAMKEGAE